MATFIARMLGAARLDSGTYEEVEADAAATPQALAVVLLASVGSGIGWIGASPTWATSGGDRRLDCDRSRRMGHLGATDLSHRHSTVPREADTSRPWGTTQNAWVCAVAWHPQPAGARPGPWNGRHRGDRHLDAGNDGRRSAAGVRLREHPWCSSRVHDGVGIRTRNDMGRRYALRDTSIVTITHRCDHLRGEHG